MTAAPLPFPHFLHGELLLCDDAGFLGENLNARHTGREVTVRVVAESAASFSQTLVERVDDGVVVDFPVWVWKKFLRRATT